MKELAFQSEILKSARLMGGFGQKIAHRFKVGIPDLLLSMPGSGMVLLECKSLNEVGDVFNRNTGITSIQQETLAKYNATQSAPIGAQLIYLVHHGEPRAVVWPADEAKLSYKYEMENGIWVKRDKKEPHWNLSILASAVKLSRFSRSAEKRTAIF